MSKLEELIAELCPNGVEHLSTNDVKLDSFWLMPSTPKYTEMGIPYITSKNVRNGKIDFDNVSYISQEDYENISANRGISVGDVLITMIGTIGEVCIVDDERDFYGQNLYLVRLDNNKILTKYFYYFITSAKIKNSLVIKKNTSSQGYIKAGSIENLKLPLPPLSVQSEIVRILDIFTELTAVLTTELQKRREQFRHYSTVLFDDAKKSGVYPIEEICHIEKGKTPIQKAVPGEYPMVVTTTERKSCDTYQFDAKAVCIPLVSSRGHGVASLNHVYYQEGRFALGNILCAIIPKNEEQVHPKYLYYYFEQTKDYTLVPLMKGGANVSLHMNDIKKVKVPIPSLEEQKLIVDILDRFDTLCNDITTGLPAEIEARRKQYEYYRDRLLSFKEL